MALNKHWSYKLAGWSFHVKDIFDCVLYYLLCVNNQQQQPENERKKILFEYLYQMSDVKKANDENDSYRWASGVSTVNLLYKWYQSLVVAICLPEALSWLESL